MIIAPSPELPGGVSNYYNLFAKYLQTTKHTIHFFYVGSELNRSIAYKLYRTWIDSLRFLRIVNRYDIVQINPSLGYIRGLMRDAFYNSVSKYVFRKKTIVFFRGWNTAAEKDVEKNINLFNWGFACDLGLVLSSEFLGKLKNWNFRAKVIALETTTFEKPAVQPIVKKRINKVLFLARFSPEKGGEVVLKTFSILTKRFPELMLYMAGDGPAKEDWERLADSLKISDKVKFTGYVKDDKKTSLLLSCDLLFFPTAYGEGMPNAIIEALGFGLIVIATPVGGIADIIKDNVNGWTLDSNSPNAFISFFEHVLNDNNLTESISRENIEYALEKFEIRKVIERFSNYYCNL